MKKTGCRILISCFGIVICSTTPSTFSYIQLHLLYLHCLHIQNKWLKITKLTSKSSVLLFKWDTVSLLSLPSDYFFWGPLLGVCTANEGGGALAAFFHSANRGQQRVQLLKRLYKTWTNQKRARITQFIYSLLPVGAKYPWWHSQFSSAKDRLL